jgi:hypothetical protein
LPLFAQMKSGAHACSVLAMAFCHRELFLKRLTTGARTSADVLPHFEKPWAIYAVTLTTRDRRLIRRRARCFERMASFPQYALRTLRHLRHARSCACSFQPWPKNEARQRKHCFWSTD